MCGILAYSGENPVNSSNFKILFLYSQTRGSHATGFGTIQETKKANESSPYFIATNKIPSTNVIVGHTRNPSTGQGDADYNAQPFDFSNIVGVHNGFINNYYPMRQELGTDVKYSDSYHSIAYINKVGGERAISEMKGSFAFAWIDKQSETLYLYRHNKPIHIGRQDGGIYVASEKKSLEAIDCENIKKIPEHKIVTIKNGVMSKKLLEVHPKKEKHVSRRRERNSQCGFQNPSGVRNTNYGRDHIQEYNEKLESESILQLKPLKAPASARSMWYNGYINYYWKEENVLHIETLKSETSSDIQSYDLGFESTYKEAEKQFEPILKKVIK